VRAVGRGIARLEAPQLRRIETVESDPERLRPVADQRPQDVERVGLPVRGLQGRVRRHHVDDAFPDQRAHCVGAFTQAEKRAGPAHVAHLADALERAPRNIEHHEEDEAGDRQADHGAPRTAHVRAQPAQGGRTAFLRRAPACEQQQAQQQENVQAGRQSQLRTAALRVHDRYQLYDQDEQVRACPNSIAESAAFTLEQLHQAVEQPLQRQEHGHDEIGCDEDRVAHVGGHAFDHIASPRQRVQPRVLDDAVDGNGKRRDDDCVQQPVDLRARAQVRQDCAEDQDVAEERERSLQPDVGAEETDARHQGQRGAYEVAGDQDQRRQDQRGAPQPRP